MADDKNDDDRKKPKNPSKKANVKENMPARHLRRRLKVEGYVTRDPNLPGNV